MIGRSLKISYRKGRPLAAYLTLPRRTGDKSAKTLRLGDDIVVDLSADGRPIGVECLSNECIRRDTLDDVLAKLAQPPITDDEANDWFAPHEDLPERRQRPTPIKHSGAINPVQFAHSICDEFLRYVFSAFPLSDPELAEQAKRLLERPSSLDIPLVKGPFVSLSESFAKGELIQKLASDGVLHPVMPGLIGYPTMYLHQQQVFEAVRKGMHVLVSTGTGSGKTESFLYPIIDDLLRQRDQGITAGLTAVLVYPMNALANDQLDRLRDVLGGTGITFGQWVGTTPAKEEDVTVERFGGSSRQAFLEARRKRREEAQAEDRAVRPLAPNEECCSESDIEARKPRILLTNYRQLEVLMTRLPHVQMFAEAPLKYLVFDEAHTYAGATGAEVACLVRRLKTLAGKSADEITCIATSATLSDPSKPEQDNEETVRRFASRFFGVDPNKVKLVGESYVSREWPKQRYRPVAPHGDGMDRLGRILDAVTEPVQIGTVKSVVEEVTGQIFDPGNDWQESLFDHLVTNEYVYQATQILKHPKWLSAAAWQTSQRLAPGRLPEGDRANAELLSYLVLGAAARKSGDSLLRPKVHFFLRGDELRCIAPHWRQNQPFGHLLDFAEGPPSASSSSRFVTSIRAPVSAGDVDQYAFSVPSSFCVAFPLSKPFSLPPEP